MSLRNFIAIRRLATSGILRAPILSSEYRSSELWKERFQCPIICNEETIKVINNKIMSGSMLNNLELDIFINVASPSEEDKAQLQEAATLLAEFRKTIMAHRLLPSTPHAVCRLFLDSESLPSLVTLLDNRVKFGIFPDFFSNNLMLDAAIDSGHHALASKIASLVMLQEEFGANQITDKLSLLALVQYISSKTDFQDWPKCDATQDPVLLPPSDDKVSDQDTLLEEEQPKAEGKQADDEDEEEDEEDAEYIRVPFLRNPYFDNHFDLTDPRVICGKSLYELGGSLNTSHPELSLRAKLLGSILRGAWDEATDLAKLCETSKITLGPTKEVLQHFTENLHELEAPTEDQKKQLSKSIEALSGEGPSFDELVKRECENLSEHEIIDINELRSDLKEWSQKRENTKRVELNKIRRDQLIAEIGAKREELRHKEDYLYFYDKLKKSKMTRIEYN